MSKNNVKSESSGIGNSAWRKKASDAFHNAKQRCNNPKNGSYSRYGGRGIRFMFDSFGEFLDTVGLPSKQSMSLDRIDADGHYAPGNCRWVEPAAQALNKSGKPGGPTLRLDEVVGRARIAISKTVDRRRNVEAWEAMLAGIRRGSFSKDEMALLGRMPQAKRLCEAGWELNDGEDAAEPPSYFTLPSLTDPGKTVTLRGGPFRRSEDTSRYGTLVPLGLTPPIRLIPEKWTRALLAGLSAPEFSGVAFCGRPTHALLQAGGMEGLMLTAASRFRHRRERPKSAAFLPMLRLEEALIDLGSPRSWDTHATPLSVELLFVPDFQIDAGREWNAPTSLEWKLAELKFRRSKGRSTVLGVQNHNGLASRLHGEVFGHLAVKDISRMEWEPVERYRQKRRYFSGEPQLGFKSLMASITG